MNEFMTPIAFLEMPVSAGRRVKYQCDAQVQVQLQRLTGVDLLEHLVDVDAIALYTAGRALLLAILLGCGGGGGLRDLGALLACNDGGLGHFMEWIKN